MTVLSEIVRCGAVGVDSSTWCEWCGARGVSADKILSKVGEGTFGRVLECWDRKLKRYCAIKVREGREATHPSSVACCVQASSYLRVQKLLSF